MIQFCKEANLFVCYAHRYSCNQSKIPLFVEFYIVYQIRYFHQNSSADLSNLC
nr:MAG TPA: hypothetical protein [Caudoviricetes sp.]